MLGRFVSNTPSPIGLTLRSARPGDGTTAALGMSTRRRLNRRQACPLVRDNVGPTRNSWSNLNGVPRLSATWA